MNPQGRERGIFFMLSIEQESPAYFQVRLLFLVAVAEGKSRSRCSAWTVQSFALAPPLCNRTDRQFPQGTPPSILDVFQWPECIATRPSMTHELRCRATPSPVPTRR